MSPFEELETPVAFVFSGGISHGAIQVGMIRAVCEAGFRPQLMVGSSAGALNAAFLAREFSEAQVHRLADIWIRLRLHDVFGRLGLRRMARLFFSPSSLASHEALEALIAAHIPEDYESLCVPLTVIATDYRMGSEKLFSAGPLRRHLLASAAIPVVFAPVPVDDHLYMDGSVSAHVPLIPAQRLGARSLVVFDVGFACDMKDSPAGLIETALHTFSLMLHRQSTGRIAGLDPSLTVLYLPSPCPLRVPAYDFAWGRELVEAGYQTARAFLEGLRLQGPGIYGSPHSHAD